MTEAAGGPKVGLIVNPVAGLGGRVGLKGSDGEEIQQRALELGAEPRAHQRAVEAMTAIGEVAGLELITWPGEMGEDVAAECGLPRTVTGSIEPGKTGAVDTRNAATKMREAGVDLLLFAGGDGTARDIFDAVGPEPPVLGIPAGVKIHSGAFATTPVSAGDLASLYLRGRVRALREMEVLDIDEDALREGTISVRLYGYLKVPFRTSLIQSLKSATGPGEEAAMKGIAASVIEGMRKDTLYIIGPGTTTREIVAELGLEKTLIGVDVIEGGELVAADANESQILSLIEGRRAVIVVTPIGGQGCILGRGNQQISPEVVRRVGRENIIVVGTPGKLNSLAARPLWVDTGDREVDEMLSGHYRVMTGYGEEAVCRVSS